MKKHFLRSLLALLASINFASACYPGPEFANHEVTDKSMAIATALVAIVELQNTEISPCWQVDYSDVQYLYR